MPISQDNRNKNQNKQMGPNQTYKPLHSKGNHKPNEKTAHRIRENICKWCVQRGLKFPKYTNSSSTLTTKKQSNWKMGRRPK